MKINKYLALLVGILALAGCAGTSNSSSVEVTPTPSDTSSEQQVEIVSLDVVKSTYKNNQEVVVEGVVYGVTKNGFFVTDSASAGIFVNMGDNWTATVKIGDKVQVDAKYSLVSGYCMLKQAKVETVATNETVPVVAVEKELTFVNDLVASVNGDYGMLVKLVGTLSEGSSNTYVLTDDTGNTVKFASNSAAHLATYVGKRIIVETVVYRTDSEGKWQLVFAGDENDIVDATLTFADYVELAKQELNKLVPATCTGNLNLPAAHSVDSSMTYTWAVKSGTSVTITETGVVVVPPTADEEVVLTVTIARGEETQTVDYTIISKAVVEKTVGQFMSEMPVSGDAVKVTGVVVAMGRNQGSTAEPYAATKRYVMIQDEQTSASVPVNYLYSSNDYGFEGLSVGDKVTVEGTWSNEVGETNNPTINANSLTLVAENTSVADAKATATVISTKADYEALASNPENYVGQLLKFDNPYLVYSASKDPNPSNWVRFGYDENVSKLGTRSVATLIGLGNENVDNGWDKHFNIPLANTPGAQFAGDIYAYVVYNSANYLQLCIPSASYISLENADQQAAYESICALPNEVDSEGQLQLDDGVTYTFSNEIIGENGKVGLALENTTVSVTVTKGSQSYTKEITVVSATTYELAVGTEINGTTTLSKTSQLLENEEVTATFAPSEGYVTVSYTVTSDDGTVTYPAYKKEQATVVVPGNATITANYVAAANVTNFNYSGGKSVAYYYVNGEYKNSSGSKTYTYDDVMACIKDQDGNVIDPTIFGVEPITTFANGKWANFFDSSSRIALFSDSADEYSGFKFTSQHTIYSITVTYLSDTYASRASVQSNGVELVKNSEGSAVYSYMVNGNEFSITNISGGNYLYMKSIDIVYAAPSTHELEKDADGHWSSCPTCDHAVAKEAHNYENCKYESDDEGHSAICTECNYVSAKENHTYVEGTCECGKLEPVADVTYVSTTINASNPNYKSKLLYGNANGEWLSKKDATTAYTEEEMTAYIKDTDGNSYNTELFDIKAIANADTGKVINFSYSSSYYTERVMQIQPTAGITIECTQKIAYVIITYATNDSTDNSTRGLVKVGEEVVTGTENSHGVHQYTVNANTVTIMSNETDLGGDSVFIYSIEIVYEA